MTKADGSKEIQKAMKAVLNAKSSDVMFQSLMNLCHVESKPKPKNKPPKVSTATFHDLMIHSASYPEDILHEVADGINVCAATMMNYTEPNLPESANPDWMPEREDTDWEEKVTNKIAELLDVKTQPYHRILFQLWKDHAANLKNILLPAVSLDAFSKSAGFYFTMWLVARELQPGLPPPFVPLVKFYYGNWKQEQARKPISREGEQRKPGAILPQNSVSNVRYPNFDSYVGVFSKEPISEVDLPLLDAPSATQLYFPGLERKMYLPEYLPIQIVEGVTFTARDNVLPYGIRFFFEVGMSLKPKQRQGYYCKTLRDAAEDIGIVEPKIDGKAPRKEKDKTYLRKGKIAAIQNAIEVLNIIRFPYWEPNGELGGWFPFRPLNIPSPESSEDFPIRVWLNLPLDDTGGVLVERTIVRALYQNLRQFNAYLAACVLFNKYGRSPHGNLINPTEPDPESPRNEHGHLLNPNTGDVIVTDDKEQTPVKDLFASEAVAVLNRVYRDKASNYPTLDEEELMRAVFPNEPYKKDKAHKSRSRNKAWEAWYAIAEKGYIRIEKKQNGLWILPSDKHIALHHEILESSKKDLRD